VVLHAFLTIIIMVKSEYRPKLLTGRGKEKYDYIKGCLVRKEEGIPLGNTDINFP